MLADTMGELLQQIPPLLIINVCGSGLLLAAALVYFAIIKPRRRKAREKAETVADAAPTTPDTATAASTTAAYDLPDLDMLVDDSGFEREAEPAPPPAPATPDTAPAPVPVSRDGHIRLNTGETITAEEVVSVRRDTRDGRLVVYIDGVGYRSLVDVPDVKNRFVTVMKQLNRVVTQPDSLAVEADDAPQSAPEPAQQEKAKPQPADSVQVEILPPDAEQPAEPPRKAKPKQALGAPPPPDKDGAIPGALPSYNMDEAVKPVKGGRFGLGPAKYEFAEVPELDIAGAIEAYLQHRIAYTPEFQGRNIHVHAAPGGVGVRIQVEDQFYDMVDEVEDADAREFISAVIEEWQSRQ